jgi:hypothetical protein
MASKRKPGKGSIEAQILEQLRGQGVDLSALACCDDSGTPVRVVCVAANVGHTLDVMGQSARDQVVMVRVDADTANRLDAWVETGAVKSRSEAAALFIREGLQVRASELSRLQDAIDDVEAARGRLKARVKEVLGTVE